MDKSIGVPALTEQGRVKTRDLLLRSAGLRKAVAILSAYQCAFPECHQELLIEGAFIGEVASIDVLQSANPRYNRKIDASRVTSLENYLLLCPNHRRIVDRQPSVYTAQWLKTARANHLKRVKVVISQKDHVAKSFQIPQGIKISLSDALSVWNESADNNSEKYWQELFERCPAVLSQLFPRSMIQFGANCYVGGKSVQNVNGNLVDFIYANPSTNNIVLIEIKAPGTPLIGKKYRQNAYTMSDELSGSVVQVLNYRDTLIKEYYSLSKPDNDTPFNVFSPKCVVIVGNVQSELLTPVKRKSFELFRGELAGVDIVGYDELFEKIQCVIDIAK